VPPATAPEPVRTPEPPPSPEDVRVAAATPKAVGQSAAATRGPVALSSDATAQPSAAPRAVAPESGGGPVAPVALPPGLARGASGGGTGGVTAAGTGGAAGTGDVAGAGAGTGVDTADPDFSEYFRLIERRVRSAWRFPESLGGTTQTVKIGFSLAPDGGLRDARVVSSSSGVLNGSALAAMKQASPFPPLPVKFKALAGQPLVMSFTVTIR
jgi:TonB family protein